MHKPQAKEILQHGATQCNKLNEHIYIYDMKIELKQKNTIAN